MNGTLTTLEDTSATSTLAATDVDGDTLTYAIVVNGTKGTRDRHERRDRRLHLHAERECQRHGQLHVQGP